MHKGRLAPSPTGAQHLGNARTYLIAFWAARNDAASLAMRIEDIDSPRVKPWATQQAIDDLRWLGIDWEEGPDVGGSHEPYIQTQRVELYNAALAKLIEANRVFPCTCTRKDIANAASAPHETRQFSHEGPVYPGTCADWQTGDSIPEQGTFSWRFRVQQSDVFFIDQVLGPQRCNPMQQLGDFPITQKNGQFSYQLAVVVDDAAMQVTHVVRGDDLVPSAFRQIELYQALGLKTPAFAHVPLIRGHDNRRLAKRHGDTRLSEFRDRGVPPEKIVGWAAHTAGFSDELRPMKANEMIQSFAWQDLHREDVVLDRQTLEWIEG